jgi:hypothetical protein
LERYSLDARIVRKLYWGWKPSIKWRPHPANRKVIDMTERTWPANTPTDGPGSRTRLALVTGASSGIGRAFARWLGADGYDLVVVGRRRDRLEELAVALPDVKVRPLVADLGTDAGVEVVADLCASEELTMLVNNAGVAHYMPFNELPPDKANELLHVKVVAPTMLARAAASGMVARGEGTIINVGMDGPTSPGCCPITRSGVRFGQRR